MQERENFMLRFFFVLGAISAFLAVGAGAFGAHGLEKLFAEWYAPERAAKMLRAWETAVRYQMYHALALLVVAWACERWPGRPAHAAGWLFLAGSLLFSGSLYALCLNGPGWLGPLTPVGGAAFMAGWVCLIWAASRMGSR